MAAHHVIPRTIAQKISTFIASRLFFWLSLLLFVVEAAWIALSARYPQAFDEQFHFGLIQLYSHHLSPWLNNQPAGANQFGAVSRDPSFLYHYLFSFPYRLLAHFTSNQQLQIEILRFCNISLFTGGVLLFRRVLGLTKASAAQINFTIFCFVLTPVVPLLASQINYDNLMLPVIAFSLLRSYGLAVSLRDRQSLNWSHAGQLVVIWLLGSLVKYAFLPIAGAESLLLGSLLWRQRQHRQHWAADRLPRWKLVLYGGLIVLSLGLFTERYGVNLARYYTLTPECDQVLTIDQCKAYGPWNRNYNYYHQKIQTPGFWRIATYPFDWTYHLMGELVFTIGSAYNQNGTVDYYTGSQLIVMEVLGWLVLALFVVVILRYGWAARRHLHWQLFGLTALLYLLALGGQNILDFIHLNQVTAVHGRYLLPFVPIFYLATVIGLQKLLDNWHWRPSTQRKFKAGLSGVVGLLMLTQGGFVTYVVRNDDRWIQDYNGVVKQSNHKAKNVLKHSTIDIKPKAKK